MPAYLAGSAVCVMSAQASVELEMLCGFGSVSALPLSPLIANQLNTILSIVQRIPMTGAKCHATQQPCWLAIQVGSSPSMSDCKSAPCMMGKLLSVPVLKPF